MNPEKDKDKKPTKDHRTLQDRFLHALRTKKIRCVLFTMNGVQVHGMVSSFDSYVVVMWDPDKKKQSLIYKHAISTILPSEFVRLDEETESEEKT